MHCPLERLRKHYHQAIDEGDQAARYCTLVTVESQQARSRTVVLRDIGPLGPLIFVNDCSPKWSGLSAGGSEVLLFWPTLMRQYRLRGRWQVLGEEEMRAHWQHKPETSKLLDHVYQHLPQSSVLASREQLQQALATLREGFAGQAIPYASSARGAVLVVDYIEDWCGAADGLHERCCYTRQDGVWQKQYLVP